MGEVFVVWAGGDGGQGAILGDNVGTHAALSPGDTFGSLSVFPGYGQDTLSVYRLQHKQEHII